MRKNLLTLGILVSSLSPLSAQVLTHVDKDGMLYVGKDALVYNGGGMQVKGSGVIENHGNVMIEGDANAEFKTVLGSTSADNTVTGKFINKLNEPGSYASVNTAANPSVYTYGQLYISGISQDNITGIVEQEYRQAKHGAYQQIGLPFFGKTFTTLNSEFGKTFTDTRRSENEILRWNNAKVVFDNVSTGSQSAKGTDYYSLGSKSFDASATVYTLKGRPVAEENAPDVTLSNAGNGINFGSGGNAINQYNGRYNTYLQDGFHVASGGTAWSGNFGKNIYQFGNPFMTNLDLSKVAYNEGASGDGNFLGNILGIRFEVSGVQYSPNSGGGSTSYKYVTFASVGNISGTPSTPVGDVDYMVVRPLGTFVIKLKDNNNTDVLNFKKLRRFGYIPRTSNDYSVTASRSASSGTSKQLGVIGLDADGNEVARAYYVVYPDAISGNSTQSKSQVTNFSTSLLGTYEEDAVNGGYDNNYTGAYWLYINEANEEDFKGKNIKLVNYDLNKIKSYKFEIRENAALVADGTHELSSGTGFYFRGTDGLLKEVKQGEVTSVLGDEYDLYYGKPNSALASDDVKPSRTKVVFNPAIDDYVVIFDPNWKVADISVYDLSGRLVLSAKKVKADNNYTIKLDSAKKGVYVVDILAENGEKLATKILKK